MFAIRISAPERATPGEIVELKALIRHPQESGFRLNARGVPIPRDILTRFVCLYNDQQIFAANLYPGVSANPFLSFHTRATRTGTLTFRWTDQDGESYEDSVELVVE
ncbi:MAG: thiosulfate oxidation carrier complex protein SoxZ [Pseudomonadota bacterium]